MGLQIDFRALVFNESFGELEKILIGREGEIKSKKEKIREALDFVLNLKDEDQKVYALFICFNAALAVGKWHTLEEAEPLREQYDMVVDFMNKNNLSYCRLRAYGYHSMVKVYMAKQIGGGLLFAAEYFDPREINLAAQELARPSYQICGAQKAILAYARAFRSSRFFV